MGQYRRVTYEDRCQIRAFLQVKESVRNIASRLELHKSTIYRELGRNKRQKYFATSAQRYAEDRKKKCRRPYLVSDELEGQILFQLFRDLSPEQISKRLACEKMPSVSHQTIYNYIKRYRRDLKPYLRRFNRRGASRVSMKAHKSTNKLSIKLRPQEANLRTRIGDWERDGMYGANGKQLLVCIDRKSRFIKIARMPSTKVGEVAKLTNTVLQSAGKQIHTITNDNGPEFRYGKDCVAPVYYCMPRKPQQRGTVENTIGLIRQYIKRTTNLSDLSDEYLQQIEDHLNLRPRKCLDYKTPYEVFYGKTVALAI